MKPISIGILTPSSNTVLEYLTRKIVDELPNISIHYARFKVTEISLGSSSNNQFNTNQILQAAELLSDAHVDVIVWNGTSSGWLGFESDEILCESIYKLTKIPACTSVLALNEIMNRTSVGRFALVSPYLEDVQRRIIENYARIGFECIAEQHLDKYINYDFCKVTENTLHEMVAAVSKYKPDCIVFFCTNLKAAQLVSSLEEEFGIPVYDTISVAMWKALMICGVDVQKVIGWGRLFQEVSYE